MFRAESPHACISRWGGSTAIRGSCVKLAAQLAALFEAAKRAASVAESSKLRIEASFSEVSSDFDTHILTGHLLGLTNELIFGLKYL